MLWKNYNCCFVDIIELNLFLGDNKKTICHIDITKILNYNLIKLAYKFSKIIKQNLVR